MPSEDVRRELAEHGELAPHRALAEPLAPADAPAPRGPADAPEVLAELAYIDPAPPSPAPGRAARAGSLLAAFASGFAAAAVALLLGQGASLERILVITSLLVTLAGLGLILHGLARLSAARR